MTTFKQRIDEDMKEQLKKDLTAEKGCDCIEAKRSIIAINRAGIDIDKIKVLCLKCNKLWGTEAVC